MLGELASPPKPALFALEDPEAQGRRPCGAALAWGRGSVVCVAASLTFLCRLSWSLLCRGCFRLTLHPRVLGCSQWCPVNQWSLVVPERVSEVGVTCDANLVTSPLVSDFSLHVLEWKLSLSHTRLVSFPELQGENRGRERR